MQQNLRVTEQSRGRACKDDNVEWDLDTSFFWRMDTDSNGGIECQFLIRSLKQRNQRVQQRCDSSCVGGGLGRAQDQCV